MNKKALNIQLDYWYTSANKDWKTAQYLFEGKYYDACLFFCHLANEKLLKALVIKQTNKIPPFIHHLERLADIAELDLDKEKRLALIHITGFNIAGRYSSDKSTFHKQCTKPFTARNLSLCKEIFLWLKKEYHEK